jgi:CheY-like chemotaxis protein
MESQEGNRIKAKVLVVDDSRSGRRIMQALLTVLGFEVFESEDAASAIAMIQSNRLALATVDRVLGTDDGVELVRAMRRHPNFGNSPKILAVTGQVGRQHEEAFRAAGADAYLGKPFKLSEIATVIRALGFGEERDPSLLEHVQEKRMPVFRPDMR